jgi:hypothetical protein
MLRPSGSQAKNIPLMRVLATVLDMPVCIPPEPSLAVVLGAAMLGRFAHEQTLSPDANPLTDQIAADQMKIAQGEDLWRIMSEMTPPAFVIHPMEGGAGASQARLLDAKYQIFKEAIDVQRRWRSIIDNVDWD